MKVKELIKLVNGSDEPIYSLYNLEDFIELPKCVAMGLNYDKHRWYALATNVYECEDGFVGITGVDESYSEDQTYSDIGVECEAEEYEEIQTVTYRIKHEYD